VKSPIVKKKKKENVENKNKKKYITDKGGQRAKLPENQVANPCKGMGEC